MKYTMKANMIKNILHNGHIDNIPWANMYTNLMQHLFKT